MVAVLDYVALQVTHSTRPTGLSQSGAENTVSVLPEYTYAVHMQHTAYGFWIRGRDELICQLYRVYQRTSYLDRKESYTQY